MTTYVPIYAGVTDLPEEYKTDGRTTGISHRSAWWAFRQVATISAHRWGDMPHDVAGVRDPLQEQFLSEQKTVVKKACRTPEERPREGPRFLTETTAAACRQAIGALGTSAASFGTSTTSCGNRRRHTAVCRRRTGCQPVPHEMNYENRRDWRRNG